MIIGLIIGLFALVMLFTMLGFSIITSLSMHMVLFFLLMNVAFLFAVNAKEEVIEIMKLTFGNRRETIFSKEKLLKFSKYHIIINLIILMVIGSIVMFSCFTFVDPSAYPYLQADFYQSVFFVLIFVMLIFIPQRFILLTKVDYTSEIEEKTDKEKQCSN